MAQYGSYLVLLSIALGLGGPAVWLFIRELRYGNTRE